MIIKKLLQHKEFIYNAQIYYHGVNKYFSSIK